MIVDEQIMAITILMFVLSAFALFVFIRYAREQKLLYFLIPVILALSIYTYSGIQHILGNPVYAVFDKEFIYLAHVVDNEQKWIYIYVFGTEEDDRVPKSYKINFTTENEQALAEAQQKSGEGVPQGLEFLKEDSNASDGFTEDTLKLYDFNKLEGVTKDDRDG
jgi:hypothetical protein